VFFCTKPLNWFIYYLSIHSFTRYLNFIFSCAIFSYLFFQSAYFSFLSAVIFRVFYLLQPFISSTAFSCEDVESCTIMIIYLSRNLDCFLLNQIDYLTQELFFIIFFLEPIFIVAYQPASVLY
jgi:hypothetical protein